MTEKMKTTAPVLSVGADREQPNTKNHKEIIANETAQINLQAAQNPEKSRSGGLQTVSMTELYDTVYPPRTPVVDGFLYGGTYLFVGAPKVGKSFFMGQLAYHVAMGLPLWDYPVRKGTVLYLALEDDYARLQRRLSGMFGVECADNLYFATQAKTLNEGLGKSQCCSVIILGGIGFSGLNEKFNASNIRYGKSFDELSREAALRKDIQEAIRFNTIYTKILKSLGKSRVIVLTHVKKGDWNTEPHNPYWIYLNGHNHQNFYEVSDRRTIYADNQIGYRTKNIGLKYFYCDNNYDIFAYYQDGIHEITREQYIDFNRGKLVSMSFKREDGTIYMLKRNSIYLFLIYCEYSKRSRGKSLYLMNGGKLGRLGRNRIEDLAYYYDNLKKYVENVNQLLYRYVGGQQRISEFIKHLGGSGKIHGCIVDVERPNELEGFSYCHLFVNPIDGKVTPYFAYDVKSRIVYKDFKALLQAHDSCKLMANNYLRLEKESVHNLPTIQYSGQMEEWENEDSMYDEGGYLYKISRIIKSLQYCAEKNIVRLWNEELLNYDFVNRIKQSNKIDEIVDDRLMIDEKSI